MKEILDNIKLIDKLLVHANGLVTKLTEEKLKLCNQLNEEINKNVKS